MPYPAQVSVEVILAKAREVIEAEGVEALSLGKLATALNIKAPSLYRYFESKNALLRALNEDTATRLVTALQMAASAGEAPILEMAWTYRAFALANPAAYRLAFSNTADELRPDEHTLEQLVLPLQAAMATVSGDAESLAALRGIWALIHGFVSLELAGQFRRGGDLDAAFRRAILAYLDGWATSAR